MNLEQYIVSINNRFKLGNATEHSFRGDLQQLIEGLAPEVKATNEPKRQECGAPDYIITRKGIPLGYIEAKDIRADLGSKNYKEQFDRYKQSLQNLIITDYLNFQLFREGTLVNTISIGQVQGNKIVGKPDKYEEFTLLIKDFCTYTGQTIKSSAKLSKMMAAKARLLANVIERALLPGESANLLSEPENLTLHDQFNSFKQVLLHDIKEKEFADIYAQTIAYGMFAARLHDPSLIDFSRQEAAELIPKSNPFLRKLFQYIAGYDLDDRIKWIVDDLADIFRATNVAELLKDFGKSTQQNDPLVHFYETFLSEYDPKLRKSRGVWYTPEPVVNFIVRAVDDILKAEFGLPMGLADTSKTTVTVNVQGQKVKKEVHKVQILDPATGTGTFLAEVVKQVYKQFEGQQGLWNNYVEEHLIPRLNGFEILMASYTIAHLKLDMLLRETGYQPTKDQRFKIYLTNSLEEYHPDTGTLFANWLSAEANEANHIKRDTPVMVVLGNPPYSGESANKGEWIMKLMEDYKKEPGGKEKLKERNPKWINDDYVKFIRYGQDYIEKNGSGILAYINPHGFLDNPTFRGMRWNLLKTFDKIYTIDLHGNSKKKETCPDGSPDENVFDIMQGVSINLFIKNGKKKNNELGQVYIFDQYGKRSDKYHFLYGRTLNSILFVKISNADPNFFFVKKNIFLQQLYDKGFKISELMNVNVLGFQTHRDQFALDSDFNSLLKRLNDFLNPNIDENELKKRYRINESKDWDIKRQREDLKKNKDFHKYISLTSYRPFDNQYAILDKSICDRPRNELLQHVLNRDNICLLSSRQQAIEGFHHVFISKHPANDCLMSTTTREANQVFPLFIYPKEAISLGVDSIEDKIPNFNPEIIEQVISELGLNYSLEQDETKSTFSPIDILDYIYAVLHSPTYREKYKEFLKIDFPRIPYPKDQNTFWQLVKLGGELRKIHLMESPILGKLITKYPVAGSNEVGKVRFEMYDYEASLPNDNGDFDYPDYLGAVYINDTQYFADVPTSAWEFYIGGYQPAQKWLKDRKGRTLNFEDIIHYQKIIVALTETDRIMKEIDKIEIE
jgi:predicted helicase